MGSHINHLDNSICYTTRWAWSRSDGSCLAAWYRGHQASFGKRSSTASLSLLLYCWQCQQELKYQPKILVRRLLITDLLKARTTVDSIKWLFCENTRNKPAVQWLVLEGCYFICASHIRSLEAEDGRKCYVCNSHISLNCTMISWRLPRFF